MSSVGPCKNCERKGCGSYHDKCEPYLKWREECEKAKKQPTPHRDYIKASTYESRKKRRRRIFKSPKK